MISHWKEFGAGLHHYGISLFTAPVCLLAVITAALGHYWNQAPELWRVLGIIAPGLCILDLFTGIAKSTLADHKRFCSEGLGRSLVKAYVYITLFLLCLALDGCVRTGYSAQLALLVFIVVREGESNLENLSALKNISGVEIPDFIRKGFDQLERKNKDDHRS